MLVLAFTAAAVASAVAWMVDQRRCRRRNEQGECGACSVLWAETPSGDPYLIHGRLVCEGCAQKAKRRMPWQLGALGGWAASIAAIAAGKALAGNGVAVMLFFIVGSAIVVPLGAVQLMKLANRRAQRRIAAGEFPDFNALGAEASTEPERSLPEGLNSAPDH